MKFIKVLIILLTFVSGSVSASENLFNILVGYLYFQMADEPLPIRSLVEESPLNDHFAFDNEFDRREFLNGELGKFKASVHEIEREDEFSIKVKARLGDYDFENNRFPLRGIHENTYFKYENPHGLYGPKLAMQIVNSGEFRHLNMAPEAARRLVDKINEDKAISVRFYMRPVRSEQKNFDGGGSFSMSVFRALIMYAERAVISHGKQNTELGALQATSLYKDYSPVERTLTTIDDSMPSSPWIQAWGSKDHFEALFSHYNLKEWKAFSKISVSKPCVSDFGYSSCKVLITKREQLVSRCLNTVNNKKLCHRLWGLHYTLAEEEQR